MSDKKEVVSLEEAVKEVEVAMTRVALMHLSFSKILIEEFGEQRGTELVIKSIMEYGKRITGIVSKGGQDLPKWGVYSGEIYQDEEGRYIVSGCILAKIFKEYNELDLGRLYCYVDAAKSMSSDPMKKLIHITCEACGDDQCTFEFLPTTEEERKQFIDRDNNWKNIDPRLIQEQ
ncbi:MAG: hypothetical protein ACFFC7_29315 [Candidatus Hermodarchaeota archaeon]